MTAYQRSLVLISSFLLIPTLAHAGEFTAFAPISYQRGTGAPVTETTTFSVKDTTAPYVLRIHNGGKNGEFGRVSSAEIRLNGIVIVPTSAFNQNIGFIERQVTPNSSNTLQVQLRSAPGSGFALEIIGNDLVPPLVSITSPANGLKTKETLITVTGRASDTTTSVASVTVNGVAVTLSGETFEAKVTLVEGPNIISALATDAVGNQAQVSITVTRDTTPPNVAIISPANLSTFNTNTITVSGTASDSTTSVASVTVNGLPVAVSGGAFSLTLDIGEGTRFITAVASDLLENTSTASISVTVDTTPPRVIINSPSDGTILFSSPITVSGMINDIVSGTVNGNNATVTVNGISATVSNRGFIADNISLSQGTNTITAAGRDAAGNEASAAITVTLDTQAKPKIKISSGNNKTGTIGSTLPLPLVVQLTDSGGAPVANKSVTFSVTRNDGTLEGGKRSLTKNTDSLGKASVIFTLGSHAGAGENQVEAKATGFSGSAIFMATGTASNASLIQQVNESVFRGEAGNAMPSPLQVIVSDSDGNPVSGIPVTFTVIAGGGKVDNGISAVITTNSDGKTHATWILGPDEGISNNRVEANFIGNPGLPVTFVASGVIPSDPLNTSFSGIVLTNTNLPVPGATISIQGTTLITQTDAQGQFHLTSVPVGAIHLIADGSTSTLTGIIFPYALMFETNTISGRDNSIGMPIYLVPIDVQNAKPVSPTQSALISVSNIAGFGLTIPQGTASFDSGTSGNVSVSQVHKDKVPMPPPNGMNPKIVFTIQPEDVSFDPPAPIVYPNVYGYPAGKIVNLYSFDHHLGQWVSIGTGSVTDDGAFIASDPGVGIIHGGWHFPEQQPAPTGNIDNSKNQIVDPTIRKAFEDAWNESNPGTGIDPNRHEQGGWIVQMPDGTIRIDRWKQGQAAGITPTDPPTDGKVIGSFHTHPNIGIDPVTGKEWNPRPSGERPGSTKGDVPWVLGDPNVRAPHYVISESTIYMIDNKGKVSDVGKNK